MMCASVALGAAAGDASLVTAAKDGDRATVQSLLSSRAKQDIAGAEGTAALVWAATRNDMAMADLLVRAGANVKAANEFGATALYAAAAHADPAMAAKLLAAGADPNVARLSGETPLMEAARRQPRDGACVCSRTRPIPTRRKSTADRTRLLGDRATSFRGRPGIDRRRRRRPRRVENRLHAADVCRAAE